MTDLMKELEGLPQAALDELTRAQNGDGGVQLPFQVAYFWAHNGDPKAAKLAKDCPAVFAGGWATDAEQLEALISAGELASTPKGFFAFDGAGRDGNEYRGIAGRVLSFAYIARRERWLAKDGTSAKPHYDGDTGHTRRHMQMLVRVASEGKPWGYAVMTTKGWQAKYMLDALKEWSAAIGKYAKELNAARFPLGAWWITVGTFSDKPEFVPVGKDAKTNITPMRAWIKDDFGAEQLKARFVGATVLQENAEHLAQAREWLEAWAVAQAAPAPESAPEEQEIPF